MKTQRRGNQIKPVWAILAVAMFACSGSLALARPAPTNLDAQPRQDRDRRTPPLLTDEDINLIKVYEVKLDAKPTPRVTIPKNVLNDFLEEYQEEEGMPRGKTEQRKWLSSPGHEQLGLLFDMRARSYYKHVRITSRIDSLTEWGRQHRYIDSYFRDHFGAGAVKGLYLFPKMQGRDKDRAEMTNFYILTQVQIDGKSMIDRFKPEESLLLQWGLPREDAKYAAPNVKDWRPYFKDKDDPRFIAMVEMIELFFRDNQGSDYSIKYRIPGQPRDNEEQPDNE